MARLPQPGGDNGSWGNVLNDYLLQSLNADGTIKAGVIGGDELAAGVKDSLAKADSSYQKPGSGIPLSDLRQSDLSNVYVSRWQASTAYSAGAIVALPSPVNGLGTRSSSGTSRSTFDSTEQALWTVASNAVTVEADDISDATVLGKDILRSASANDALDVLGIDDTNITPASIGAYTQAEVDDAISAAIAAQPAFYPIFGTSAWDVGNIETIARAPGFSDKSLGSGTAWFQHFYAPRNSGAITRLVYGIRSAAPSGVTLARMALYTVDASGNLTMVARTGTFTPSGTYTDQDQALSTAGGYPSSYTLSRGAQYAIGLLVVASNAGNSMGWDIPGAGNKPVISRRITAQTDLATSYANGTLSDYYEGLYLVGRTATG